MLLKNTRYLDGDFQMRKGSVRIAGDRISALGGELKADPGETAVDCGDYTVIPGMIDVHIHGCNGANVSDGSREAVDTMAAYLVRQGVTAFCPATVASDIPTIERALLAAKECMDAPADGAAAVLGVNMEGPFLSAGKIGAQMPEAVLAPDFGLFQRLYRLCGGIIRLVSVAPEQPGGMDFVEKAGRICTVAVAHTCAGYAEAAEAFDRGATHATHLFNAMTGLHHRDPGVVGAVLDDCRVRAELICDGVHIHPAVLRTAFAVLRDRAVVVSDAMRAAGLPEGEGFEQGGQDVVVRGGRAVLSDGTLAGSVTDLHRELKKLVEFGIPFEHAVRAATLAPARAVGEQDEIGSIQPGKRADLVLLDRNLDVAGVYLAGRKVV